MAFDYAIARLSLFAHLTSHHYWKIRETLNVSSLISTYQTPSPSKQGTPTCEAVYL
jgi:hypothetical protein